MPRIVAKLGVEERVLAWRGVRLRLLRRRRGPAAAAPARGGGAASASRRACRCWGRDGGCCSPTCPVTAGRTGCRTRPPRLESPTCWRPSALARRLDEVDVFGSFARCERSALRLALRQPGARAPARAGRHRRAASSRRRLARCSSSGAQRPATAARRRRCARAEARRAAARRSPAAGIELLDRAA